MGKKRIGQLLEQLQDNQQRELQNAAAIYTVAQVAVEQLQTQLQPEITEVKALPAASTIQAVAALPPAPQLIDRAELQKRYGSHAACRQAAKKLGIKFSKTPSWHQLSAAFGYFEAAQQMMETYLQTYPADLQGVSIELNLR